MIQTLKRYLIAWPAYGVTRARIYLADLIAPAGHRVYEESAVVSQSMMANYLHDRCRKLTGFNVKWARRRKVGGQIIGIAGMLRPGGGAEARPARAVRRRRP